MAASDSLPVHVDVCRKKLLKEEISLQGAVQEIRNFDGTYEELERLSAIARKSLATVRKGIQEVKLLCDEEGITKVIDSLLRDHFDSYAVLQRSLRQANIAAEERLQKRQLNLLLRGPIDNNSELVNRVRGKEETKRTTEKITEGLMRSARLMESQVKRSEESTRRLEESSHGIRKTQEEYRGLAGVIGSSKKLINKYTRRELTDTILIFFGLILFFSTVLYIVLKRV